MGPIGVYDVIIIAAYLGAMLGVGIWSSRKIKDLTDFALAGKSLGYPVMIGTLVGAAIGAASTFGKAGKAYHVGSFFFLATMGYAIGLALFGVFSRRLRRAGIWTIPDAIRARYGKGMEIIMGAVMLVAVIAVFGGQIIGMGAIFSSIGGTYGLTYKSSIIIAGAVIVFYTLVGGLFAVAYTDLIQSAIMLVGIGIILPVAVTSKAVEAGIVWDALIPEPGNLLGGMTPLYVVSIFLIDVPFCLVDPSLWQRANAARTGRVAQRSAFVTSGVYIWWSFICVLLGVLGAALIPDVSERLGSSDAVIPALTIKYLPPAAVGLCLSGLMAVMMSTASVVLLITGTTLSNDLVKPLRPEISEKGLLISARVTVLIVGILGIIFALFAKNIFDLLLLAFAIYISGVFFPTMAALYWDKATKTGAAVSAVAATLTVSALYGLKEFGVPMPFGVEPIMISLIVSFVSMYAVSVMTYDPEKATPKIFGDSFQKKGDAE